MDNLELFLMNLKNETLELIKNQIKDENIQDMIDGILYDRKIDFENELRNDHEQDLIDLQQNDEYEKEIGC